MVGSQYSRTPPASLQVRASANDALFGAARGGIEAFRDTAGEMSKAAGFAGGLMARAMPSGSRAWAMPVLRRTPSTPSSMAIVTSLAVPTPASMMTG